MQKLILKPKPLIPPPLTPLDLRKTIDSVYHTIWSYSAPNVLAAINSSISGQSAIVIKKAIDTHLATLNPNISLADCRFFPGSIEYVLLTLQDLAKDGVYQPFYRQGNYDLMTVDSSAFAMLAHLGYVFPLGSSFTQAKAFILLPKPDAFNIEGIDYNGVTIFDDLYSASSCDLSAKEYFLQLYASYLQNQLDSSTDYYLNTIQNLDTTLEKYVSDNNNYRNAYNELNEKITVLNIQIEELKMKSSVKVQEVVTNYTWT